MIPVLSHTHISVKINFNVPFQYNVSSYFFGNAEEN